MPGPTHTHKQLIYKYVDFLLTNQPTEKDTYIEILSFYEFIVKLICLFVSLIFIVLFLIVTNNIDMRYQLAGCQCSYTLSNNRGYRHSIEFKHHLASQSQSIYVVLRLCAGKIDAAAAISRQAAERPTERRLMINDNDRAERDRHAGCMSHVCAARTSAGSEVLDPSSSRGLFFAYLSGRGLTYLRYNKIQKN